MRFTSVILQSPRVSLNPIDTTWPSAWYFIFGTLDKHSPLASLVRLVYLITVTSHGTPHIYSSFDWQSAFHFPHVSFYFAAAAKAMSCCMHTVNQSCFQVSHLLRTWYYIPMKLAYLRLIEKCVRAGRCRARAVPRRTSFV